MSKIGSWLSLSLVGIACLLLNAAPARAQAYVSVLGSDSNPCTASSPCLTFACAFLVAPGHGYVYCLNPGDFGPVTINKSITIDCRGTTGTIQTA
jgi:hypothetical protein